MGNPIHTQAWKNLLSLKDRGNDFIGNGMGLLQNSNLDLSLDLEKSMISDDIWAELFNLANEQKVELFRDKMIAGDPINHTENRSVGHMWLRDGQREDVQGVLSKMQKFVEKTHQSNRYTDIVHIGIGGSDLGPRLICDALKHLPEKMNVHFVANVDAADVEEVLKTLNPATTLCVIASKTFTTIETMMNANKARQWILDEGLSVADHMIALSTNETAVGEFGIDTDNMFPFWNWVGGRFSMWSSIGMPIALTYGFDVFQQFLDGAKAMDDHFCNEDIHKNLPIMMALYGIWNRNFLDRSALAVLPYAQNLSLLSNFLQQLDMESNGKSVDRDGEFITDYKTGPIIFGQAGTNGQHAFHQWLHQGTDIVPCEFIVVTNTTYDKIHQEILNKNAKAQAIAFIQGQESLGDKHRHYHGGRPSVTVHMKDVSAHNLGQLIALYEHKTFVQGVVWNINSFDQFGVELGKVLANSL